MQHQPYADVLRHSPDFVVRYRFYTPEEGGRWQLPVQGVRFDFTYADKALNGPSVWMIWPELEDETGAVIRDKTEPVPASGTARMWIINAANRYLHQGKISLGTKGYFMEGTRRVAACEVIEIAGLLTNPQPPRPPAAPAPRPGTRRRKSRA
ncbi:hypothetical protein [Hymenobacter edaphi]|uniref:hypothetical protein n=1 Tax=Hymenobacter edaphi TaxID=2211146 RepID=UPI001A9ED0F0|nr:hypothetical protein [Hymenobacter edaphi]